MAEQDVTCLFDSKLPCLFVHSFIHMFCYVYDVEYNILDVGISDSVKTNSDGIGEHILGSRATTEDKLTTPNFSFLFLFLFSCFLLFFLLNSMKKKKYRKVQMKYVHIPTI